MVKLLSIILFVLIVSLSVLYLLHSFLPSKGVENRMYNSLGNMSNEQRDFENKTKGTNKYM